MIFPSLNELYLTKGNNSHKNKILKSLFNLLVEDNIFQYKYTGIVDFGLKIDSGLCTVSTNYLTRMSYECNLENLQRVISPYFDQKAPL